MMTDFGIPCESKLKSQVLLRLNHWLLERYKAGEPAVLIIDEAQNLSHQVLEEIRLLTNLETSTEKLLQIVLAGQPELEVKLAQPQLRQLRQRITLRSKTMPLSLEETAGYIQERLRIAGATDSNIFSPEAIEAVHRLARGIPRVTNLLCEHSLINSFVEQHKSVRRETVEEVAKEFQLDEAPSAGAQAAALKPNGESAPLVQSLLQNLSNLIERLGHHDPEIEPPTERKP
jgi:general secretion pathway protein A